MYKRSFSAYFWNSLPNELVGIISYNELKSSIYRSLLDLKREEYAATLCIAFCRLYSFIYSLVSLIVNLVL